MHLCRMRELIDFEIMEYNTEILDVEFTAIMSV